MAGHRGLPRLYPDNSLEGFRAAAELVPMVELDVRRSLDGLPVLAHDPQIGGHDIATTDWSTLARVPLTLPDRPEPCYPTTLDRVLEELPELALDIEIKNTPGDPGFDPTFSFAVEVAALARPIDVVTCFFWPTMDAVRASLPETRTGLLVDRSGSIRDALSHALTAGHELIAPHWSLLVDEPALEFVLDQGISLATWTVNDPAVAISLSNAGVRTIITDDPPAIREALSRAEERS